MFLNYMAPVIRISDEAYDRNASYTLSYAFITSGRLLFHEGFLRSLIRVSTLDVIHHVLYTIYMYLIEITLMLISLRYRYP